MFHGPKWGIFALNGQPVVTGSVMGVSYRKEYRVASYPIEDGGFRNYNKVEGPYEARVVFAVDGSTPLGAYLTGPVANVANRHSVLQSIEAALSVTDLFAIVTPEFTYTAANIVYFDYDRSWRGMSKSSSMLLLEVGAQQIRLAPPGAFTNATVAAPSGADSQNAGTVQTQNPTKGQLPLSSNDSDAQSKGTVTVGPAIPTDMVPDVYSYRPPPSASSFGNPTDEGLFGPSTVGPSAINFGQM
jgi:hypothetical protein